MKNKLSSSGIVLAALLITAFTTIHASPTVVSDAELDSISGKANTVTTSSSLDVNVALAGENQNSDIQWGFYQWSDDHSYDVSQAKGGNQFDGAQSKFQSVVTAENNGVFWGSLSQGSLTAGGDVGSGGSNKAYATMGVGGF